MIKQVHFFTKNPSKFDISDFIHLLINIWSINIQFKFIFLRDTVFKNIIIALNETKNTIQKIILTTSAYSISTKTEYSTLNMNTIVVLKCRILSIGQKLTFITLI